MTHKDTFNFLFADKDEIYLTEHLLKLNLNQYLYYQLRHGKTPSNTPLDAVFFFERVNKEVMNIYCERESACDIYLKHIPVDDSDKKKSSGFSFSFRPRTVNEEPKPQFSKSEETKRYVLRQDTKKIRETIKNLIIGEAADRYGFVFEEDAFACAYLKDSELYFSHSDIDELGKVIDGDSYASQFFLIEPVNSNKELPCLPSVIVPKEIQETINSKTWQEQLFSSICACKEGGRGCESLSAVKWDFYDNNQLKRMLLRACISKGYMPQDWEKREKILTYLLKSSDSKKVFGEEITTRNDWFRWIDSSENMNKLIREINKNKKILLGEKDEV